MTGNGFLPPMRQCGVGVVEFGGDGAGFVGHIIDFADGGDFRSRAGQEDFFEPFDFFGLNAAFIDRDAHIFGDLDNSLAGDAVQETVGDGRIYDAVLD